MVPCVELGTDGFGVRTSGGGLSPPAPSSVDPSGIPTRPTVDAEPIPAGDDADAAGDPDGLLTIAEQVPDAVPAVPPPSKTALDPDVPAVKEPVPEDAVIELPIPDEPWESEPPEQVAAARLRDPEATRPMSSGSLLATQARWRPAGFPSGQPANRAQCRAATSFRVATGRSRQFVRWQCRRPTMRPRAPPS